MLFFRNLFLYLRWSYIDLLRAVKGGRKQFREFGLTMFCGRQGGGKTISMVDYLERMRAKYPACKIYSNFGYVGQTSELVGWQMLMDERNGDDGVIFAIDEIHAEFSSNAWKDFPPELLREISQQRKQRVKIIASAQCYKDVAVQLRRQCYEIVECRTLGGRWTFQRCFDAEEYNAFIESSATPERKAKIHRKWRRSFVQTDAIRELFDTYAKIEAMRKVGFQARQVLSEGRQAS